MQAGEAGGTEKSFDMALRTNLLYDALAVPNVGVEVYLPHRWSVAGSFDCAWWSKRSSHRCWRFVALELDGRHWLGGSSLRRPYTGHHVGLCGQLYTFDFAWGRKGYLGGASGGEPLQRCHYAFGLEYGYSFPISGRLNLDLNLGLGYAGGKYYEYQMGESRDVWLKTLNRQWLGPIKAEVSLTWLFDGRLFTRGGGGK